MLETVIFASKYTAMPRPHKCCIVHRRPATAGFRPTGRPCDPEPFMLAFEEFEAIRLIDYEERSQAEAARSLLVSRPTCQRIYEHARRTLARALVEGRGLTVGGGNYALIERITDLQNHRIMKKIAVPTRSGRVDDHFGHCESYTIFALDDEGRITATESLASPAGCGCKSGIASVLRAKEVSLMLAGHMGEGARKTLASAGIEVVRGCSGAAADVVEAYVQGRIADSGEGCTTHGEGHLCPHHAPGGE